MRTGFLCTYHRGCHHEALASNSSEAVARIEHGGAVEVGELQRARIFKRRGSK